MPSRSIKDYEVSLYYDSRAGYYVAEIPSIPTCAADGPTPAEAIAALETTFAVMKEAYAEERLSLPEPTAALPVDVLSRASEVLNMSQVAQRAGMSPQTLASKLQRRTPLKPSEARAISRALSQSGVYVIAKAN